MREREDFDHQVTYLGRDLSVEVLLDAVALGIVERGHGLLDAVGLLATLQAVANLAASAIAGVLWTAVSPTAAFLYAATWMLLALAGVLLTAISQRHTTS